MRAILKRDEDRLEVGVEVSICDSRAKHLIKVIRIKIKEEVLILDGNGARYLTEVVSFEKNNVRLLVLNR